MIEKKNTVASACHPWVEILLTQAFPSFLPWMRGPKQFNPISVRAMVAYRNTIPGEIEIRGVARQKEVPCYLRFRWETRIIDVPGGLRTVTEGLGRGWADYFDMNDDFIARVRFMLEPSAKGKLQVRILDSDNKLTSTRYGMSRGKMRPPLSETRR